MCSRFSVLLLLERGGLKKNTWSCKDERKDVELVICNSKHSQGRDGGKRKERREKARAGAAILITDWNHQSAFDVRDDLTFEQRLFLPSLSLIFLLHVNCLHRFSLNPNHEWDLRLHSRNYYCTDRERAKRKKREREESTSAEVVFTETDCIRTSHPDLKQRSSIILSLSIPWIQPLITCPHLSM